MNMRNVMETKTPKGPRSVKAEILYRPAMPKSRRESRGERRQVEGESRLTRDMTESDSRRV